MVEFRKIKTKDGLKPQVAQTTAKLIPETKGLSNAIITHDDKDVKVTHVQQSSLTSDCWLIQFEGFEACARCEYFPFNPKTGKLRKTSHCGGGQTLALMIKNRLAQGMSLMDNHYAHEHFKDAETCAFVEFVKAIRKQHGKYAWQYPLNKYKRHINYLRQLLKEKQQHEHKVSLDTHFPYMQTLHDYLKAKKDGTEYPKRLFRESAHYFTQYKKCDCECVPDSRSKYKIAYRDEAYQLSEHVTVYYYHQHAIISIDTLNKAIGITLDSCGWRTPTTKERINRYISEHGYRVSQSKFVWYVGKWNKKELEWQEFYDGITLSIEG